MIVVAANQNCSSAVILAIVGCGSSVDPRLPKKKWAC